jgi:hypothetical protein
LALAEISQRSTGATLYVRLVAGSIAADHKNHWPCREDRFAISGKPPADGELQAAAPPGAAAGIYCRSLQMFLEQSRTAEWPREALCNHRLAI